MKLFQKNVDFIYRRHEKSAILNKNGGAVMKKFLVAVSLLLLCAIAVNMTGCATVKAVDLMEGITPREVSIPDNIGGSSADVTDFAVRLFKAANENGENTLISPLSVMCALAMTVNGAKGETREQMEAALGMSAEELNFYLCSYVNNLPQGDKYKLKLANSIWLRDDERFTVNRDFLQTNADFYGADIYKTPFDKQTVRDINNWVKDKTDKMIPKVIDSIPADALMYLINALAFEAEWANLYEKEQVEKGEFTLEDGTKQKVELMYATEGKYLQDESATGFIKYYNGYKYAFVALLPNEGVSVSDYIATLDGESLSALLSGAESATVKTAIPKFETEYGTEMSEVLQSMGMIDAFDVGDADFSGIGSSTDGNIYIGSVIHKTHIQVGERGTKAGAVTVIEMKANSAAPPDEIKQVYLDRPFVYMLIDCENNVPFFIGTLMDVNK